MMLLNTVLFQTINEKKALISDQSFYVGTSRRTRTATPFGNGF